METPLVSTPVRSHGAGDTCIPHSDTTPPTTDGLEVTFRYKPLPNERSIRVLDLAPGLWHESISYSLRTVHLDDENLHYEAVSYVWGDATDRRTILCNGLSVSITRNLFEALQRFRVTDATRTLWADAICINQRDNYEKTAQVRLMGVIYGRAGQVLIWLQHEEDDVVQATLNAICRSRCTMEPSLNQHKRVFYRLHGREVTEFGDVDPTETTSSVMAALSSMGRLAWFGRGWVVQEVLLSSTACVHWGNADFDFEWMRPAFPPSRLQWDLSLTRLLIYLTYGTKKAVVTLFTLLTMTIESKFSEEKDRIYGLMGLPTLEWDLREGQPCVDPDYSITTMECFRRVSVKLLVEAKDLRVLSWAQHKTSLVDESWPSWVPCYTTPVTHVFADLYDGEIKNQETASLVNISSATRGVFECIDISGFKIGTVSLKNRQYVDTYGAVRGPEGRMHMRHLLRQLQNSYSPEYLACTFAQTDTLWRPGSNSIATLMEDYHAFVDSAVPWQPNSAEPPRPDAERFFEECALVKYGHQVFQIERTGILGLGPEAMRAGDVVVALHGASVPFMLRTAKGGLWKLVGECQIYEFSKGKLTQEWKDRGGVSETFCIC